MTIGWQGKLAMCLFFVGLLLAVSTCFGMPRSDRRLAYLAVLCPPDWRATISQRYDDRDRSGRIIRSTWITRCY